MPIHTYLYTHEYLCIYVIYSHNKYAYIHIYMFMQDTY